MFTMLSSEWFMWADDVQKTLFFWHVYFQVSKRSQALRLCHFSQFSHFSPSVLFGHGRRSRWNNFQSLSTTVALAELQGSHDTGSSLQNQDEYNEYNNECDDITWRLWSGLINSCTLSFPSRAQPSWAIRNYKITTIPLSSEGSK